MYTDTSQNEMVEYHIDTEFEGNLSVSAAKEQRALIRQYFLTGAVWIRLNEEKPISLKDEGQGAMVSAFQSRHNGFCFELTIKNLEVINNKGRGGSYHDEQAAKIWKI